MKGSGWQRLLCSPAGAGVASPRSRYLWLEACTLNEAFLPQMYTHPTSDTPDCCPFLGATPRCFPAVLVSQSVLWRAEGILQRREQTFLSARKECIGTKPTSGQSWTEEGAVTKHILLSRNLSVGAALPGDAGVIPASLACWLECVVSSGEFPQQGQDPHCR